MKTSFTEAIQSLCQRAGGEGQQQPQKAVQRANLPQQLEAPVEKGQTVGTVQVYHGETLLGEYEVKAAADAPRMDFGTAFGLLWDSLKG